MSYYDLEGEDAEYVMALHAEKAAARKAKEPPLDMCVWSTYDGWRKRGRNVRKGEHAQQYQFINGGRIPLYNINQTTSLGRDCW